MHHRETLTSDTHSYTLTDLVGSSTRRIEDDVAVQHAGKTLHDMRLVARSLPRRDFRSIGRVCLRAGRSPCHRPWPGRESS